MTTLHAAALGGGRWLGRLDATSGELAALVATALGANALAYGAVLLLAGPALWPAALLVGGGLLTAAGATVLSVVHTVADVVSA